MLDEHSGCKLANCRPRALRQAVKRQKQLMLLGFKPVLTGCRFAEIQESPDLAPKLGEIAVLVQGQIIFHDLYRITI
jgi:hypothetical protein